jgi:hypothetical protein
VDDPEAAPPPPAPPPSLPAPSGSYHVETRIDLTVEGVLPEPAAQLVGTLRDFSAHPAHTLLDLAEDAGVPAVAELRAALPAALESRLEGWIDEEIAKIEIDGAPLTALTGLVVLRAEATLTRATLHSELTLGRGTAHHRLLSMDTAAGPVALGALPDEVVAATAAMTASPSQLSLGQHAFGLAYGAHAWAAMEQSFTALAGAPLRPALGALVDCPSLAARIASRCLLGICVGHAAALTQVCERGLDEVVDRARAKVTSLRFTALQLAASAITPLDDAARLRGAWTAELDVGFGLRPAPATMTARR